MASLGRVQGLSDGLTKGRKYGLCAMMGLQSISQLRDVYGKDGAQTLLDVSGGLCGSPLQKRRANLIGLHRVRKLGTPDRPAEHRQCQGPGSAVGGDGR